MNLHKAASFVDNSGQFSYSCKEHTVSKLFPTFNNLFENEELFYLNDLTSIQSGHDFGKKT